jgi:hypothetical protein
MVRKRGVVSGLSLRLVLTNPREAVTMRDAGIGIEAAFATFGKPLLASVFAVLALSLAAQADTVDIRARLFDAGDNQRVEYYSGDQVVGLSDAAPMGVEIFFPGYEWVGIVFHEGSQSDGVIEFAPKKMGPVTMWWRIEQKTPSLVERTLEVTADADTRFTLQFPLDIPEVDSFASFSGPAAAGGEFDTVRGAEHTETFPVAMAFKDSAVFGVAADSPGLWENRCVGRFRGLGRVAVLTGDGREPYPLVIKPPEDARDTYQYQMDGFQSLAAGETRTYTTWVFASPARNHYDAQVAAHIAVANAKGWNGSLVEAILRNTSYYLLRRNLARDADNKPRDGKYIFVSGPGYGWKQWVTDGFYTALGLDDPEKTIEANRAVFWTRMDYEDNAQYYLIWAVLMKRAGGTVNEELVRRAYGFIKAHEKDGL